MIPTLTGIVLIFIGLYLYTKPAVNMIVFTAACTLLPAASAVDLPALGHSSIPPAMLSLAFLGLRMVKRDVFQSAGLPLAMTKNAWLVIYCVYCAATALVLPKLFAGQISLIPMGRSGVGFVPLHVTAQNTTQAIYMLGTVFTALGATMLSIRANAPVVIVKAFVVITWVHIGTGLLDIAFAAAHISGAFDLVRTGAYAQLDQGVGSFHRISAMCPEPSVYAALGAVYFTFMCELWLRRIASKQTGPAALMMLAMLVLSTSSTAYVSIAAYAVVVAMRAVIFPGSLSLDRTIILGAVTVTGSVGILIVMLAVPKFAADTWATLASVTIEKSQTPSGIERGLWVKQGLDAMKLTHGLGVGVGSFRSSSLFTAILGSVGPAGLLVFLGYCLQVGRFGRRATYSTRVDERVGAGAAAGWTALLSLVPAAVTAASADPGALFAIMAGLSLGWRSGHIVGQRPQDLQNEPQVATASA
jgi:hypothetical protein